MSYDAVRVNEWMNRETFHEWIESETLRCVNVLSETRPGHLGQRRNTNCAPAMMSYVNGPRKLKYRAVHFADDHNSTAFITHISDSVALLCVSR